MSPGRGETHLKGTGQEPSCQVQGRWREWVLAVGKGGPWRMPEQYKRGTAPAVVSRTLPFLPQQWKNKEPLASCWVHLSKPGPLLRLSHPTPPAPRPSRNDFLAPYIVPIQLKFPHWNLPSPSIHVRAEGFLKAQGMYSFSLSKRLLSTY